MLRLLLIIALLIAAASAPGYAEVWDCGEGVAYSPTFTVNTDTTPCGGSTAVSTGFKLDTEVSDCSGWTVASSDFLFDTIWSPGTMKRHPLGDRVTLLSLPITRAFAQRFYIEAVDRTSGIGVMAGVSAEPGRLATATGTLTNLEGEIVLAESPAVTLGNLGLCPNPLGMSSAALWLGIGLDPTALLATVWGTAISVPEGETYYLVSDGGIPVTVLPEGVARPAEGEFVVLTGVPGVAELNGEQVRVFRVNGQ